MVRVLISQRERFFCYLVFFQATYQLKVNAEAAALGIVTIKETMI